MKFKFLILMLFMLIPLSYANVYNPSIADFPYSANFYLYNTYTTTIFNPNEPIQFILSLTLDLDESTFFDSEGSIFYKKYFYGIPETVLRTKITPEFNLGITSGNNLKRTNINEFPYYIKSCHVKCDKDSDSYDFSFVTNPFFRRDNGEFTIIPNRAINMNELYECKYNTLKEQYSQLVYCELNLNTDYISKGGYADPPDFLTNLRADGAYETEVRCEEYSAFNPNLDYGCNKIAFTYVINYIPTINITPVPIDLINSSLRGINETTVSTPNEGEVTDPTSDRTKTEQDSREIEKQRQYEQQLRLMTQKNSFLNSFIDICKILFSLILLSYYLLAIGVLSYLLSVLVPKIISFPYKAIIEFRRKK